jgi:ATP-binding cassette subfamily B (MDR/TAP) protein 1
VFGLLLSKAINMFYEPPKEIRKDSKFWAVLYLGLGFITFAALPLQYYLFGIAGGKLIERIRSKTFEKVVHQEISWFDDPTNSRCVEDILILQIHVTALEIYKEIKKRYYYS